MIFNSTFCEAVARATVFLALILLTSSLLAADGRSYIMVENRSNHIAKVVAPGSKPVRVSAGETAYRLELDIEQQNGVDAKAWWVSNPRELCVIFVRYEGKVVIAGKKNIKCLGN